MNFGKRIAIELDKKGISQKQLSERINLSESVVSRYISGEREPKASVLANIATALSTTSDYLLGIKDKRNLGNIIDDWREGYFKGRVNVIGMIEHYVENEDDIVKEEIYKLLIYLNNNLV